MVREPYVSGEFYPSTENRLNSLIESFKVKETSKISARGLILPHAGYVYSGKVAAETVSRVLKKDSIFILGPKHTDYGESFSIWPKGKWKIPYKDIPIDEELASLILKNSKYIKEDYLAHRFEHSIEVELPILYYFFKDFKFVPLACDISSLNIYKSVAEEIVDIVRKNKLDLLFIASTDMSHYEEDSIARKKDRLAIESIINLDEEDLLKKVKDNNISMCGVAPVAILICILKALQVKKAQVVLYQTSGDVTGDKFEVVGYSGIIFN